MQLSRFLLGSAAAVCLLAGPARADDPKDPKAVLLKSQQAQLAAPACRMTMNSKDADTGKSSVTLVETVSPDQMHLRQENDGAVTMEMFSDGKKTLLRQGAAGKLMEAPPAVAAMISNMRSSSSLQAMANLAKDVKVAGHETINGQAATVYVFTSDMVGVHATSKIWIADKSSLPLKGEGDTAGTVTVGAAPGQKVNAHVVFTYDYDPAIKVTLPAV